MCGLNTTQNYPITRAVLVMLLQFLLICDVLSEVNQRSNARDNKENRTFNDEYTVVRFKPVYLQYANTDYEASQLISNQLEHITSRFKRLLVIVNTSSPEQPMERARNFLAPVVVAETNVQRANETRETFEVSLGFSKSDTPQLDAQNAVKFANLANQIYKGTVTNIILEWDIYRFDNFEHQTYYSNLKSYMEIMRHTIKSSSCNTCNYTFTLTVPINDCLYDSNDFFKEELLVLLDEIVFFTSYSSDEKSDDEKNGHVSAGKSAAKSCFLSFERCLNIVKKANITSKITFSTEYHHGVLSPQRFQFQNLVDYWETIDWWAHSNMVQVILYSAFKNYESTYSSYDFGWWQVIFDCFSSCNIENLYYMDKKTYLERNFISTTPAPHSSTEKSEQSFTIWAAIIGAVLFLCAIFLFIVFKYVFQKVKQVEITNLEIRDFLHGQKNGAINQRKNANPESLPYDQKRFEVPTGQLVIESNVLLGSGAFGCVYRSVVLRDGKAILAAAKTLTDCTHAIGKRALLAEIKILAFIGDHENFVGFLGANTENLKQGNIYVLTEYCELGSLRDELYRLGLHKSCSTVNSVTLSCQSVRPSSSLTLDDSTLHKHSEEMSMDSEKSLTSSVNFESCMTDSCRNELVKWSFEIANGMCYLAHIKVVHADLAARNVLLNNSRTAKISDFGLSRKLYGYQHYKKKQTDYLPWRWMAPESLKELRFDEKSDVWAYGVTLWEIFTLGKLPYGGVTWSTGFLTDLENGMRLDKPDYILYNVFSLMTKCWEFCPERRPAFEKIKILLSNVFPEYHDQAKNTVNPVTEYLCLDRPGDQLNFPDNSK